MRLFLLFLTCSYFSVAGQSSNDLIQKGLDLIDTQPDSAILVFSQAIELDSSNFEPWYYVAYCHSKTGNFAETTAYAKESLRRRPEDWKALALLGIGEIYSVEKVKGCETLEKAIQINDTDADTKYVFGLLCGKYYRVTIYSKLNDSTLIDRISEHFKTGWSLSSIGEENGYTHFALINNQYQNHRDSRSFEVEWGIFLFDNRDKANLTTVRQRHEGIISEIEYRTYRSRDKELILAIIDKYVRTEDTIGYSLEKKALVNEIRGFVKEL